MGTCRAEQRGQLGARGDRDSWDEGWSGREDQKGENTCAHIADSLRRTAEIQ